MLGLASDITGHKCADCILKNDKLTVKVASISSNLTIIREHIKKIGKHCNMTDKEIFDLQVAVGEAAANAIEHGSPKGPKNFVYVTAYCNSKSLIVVVADEGKFIRRVAAPDVDIDFRGRGIPLMLALMDKVTIDESMNGTKVILEKKLINR